MLIQAYELTSLHFAYCYRLFLRFQTHKVKPQQPLAQLNQSTFEDFRLRSGIHVLECAASDTGVRLLVSLVPAETVSACASKLKGQISKWLREQLQLDAPSKLLGVGYFACTTGKSTTEAVDSYLNKQCEHHGYQNRPRSPVFVRSFELSTTVEARLKPQHAVAHLQFHVVLATWQRKGVFVQSSSEALSEHWMNLLKDRGAAIAKVTFIPDHVHIALRIHPTESPAAIITDLMNIAQEFMWENFDDTIVRAGVERLWQPSAYLGSYGDLNSTAISEYIKRWENDSCEL